MPRPNQERKSTPHLVVKKVRHTLRRKSQGPLAPSARKVYLAGMLEALKLGPATANEIEDRLGFTYSNGHGHTTGLLYVLEQRKLVRRFAKRKQERRGPSIIVWVLAEAKA